MPRKKKDQPIKMWCGYCEKWKDSHNYLNGIIVHERDDVPDGMLYVINEEEFKLDSQSKTISVLGKDGL